MLRFIVFTPTMTIASFKLLYQMEDLTQTDRQNLEMQQLKWDEELTMLVSSTELKACGDQFTEDGNQLHENILLPGEEVEHGTGRIAKMKERALNIKNWINELKELMGELERDRQEKALIIARMYNELTDLRNSFIETTKKINELKK